MRHREYRTSRPKSASLIAEHSVCQPGRPRPRGLASPEEFHPKASTERNPWPALVGRNFDPRRRRSSRRECDVRACRSPGSRRRRTTRDFGLISMPATTRRSMRAIIPGTNSVARGLVRGRKASQSRHVFMIYAAGFPPVSSRTASRIRAAALRSCREALILSSMS